MQHSWIYLEKYGQPDWERCDNCGRSKRVAEEATFGCITREQYLARQAQQLAEWKAKPRWLRWPAAVGALAILASPWLFLVWPLVSR